MPVLEVKKHREVTAQVASAPGQLAGLSHGADCGFAAVHCPESACLPAEPSGCEALCGIGLLVQGRK